MMAITAGAVPGDAFAAWLGSITEGPVDAVQIRDKSLDDRSRLELVRQARALLPSRIVTLVNGRADLCLAAEADGVHLPSDGIETTAAARLLGAGRLIGRSTHRLEEIEQAGLEGVDYVTFGPVFRTPDKDPEVELAGLAGLRRAAEIGLPVLALGGVTSPERVRACVAVGARGIAAIRLFGRLGQNMSMDGEDDGTRSDD